MPQQASAPDFSDVDQFVQGQKGGASSFDDIDSFVAGQARGAPAAAAKTPAESDFENNVMAAAAKTIPRPQAPAELRGSPPSHLVQTSPYMPGAPSEWEELGIGATPASEATSEASHEGVGIGVGAPGYPQIVSGVKKIAASGAAPGSSYYTPPQVVPTPEELRQRASGVADVASGAGQAMTPLIAESAVAAPLKTAIGFGAGYGASKAGGAIAHAAGASPEMEEMVRQLAFWAPATLATLTGLRGELGKGGKSAVVSALGDQVGVGVKKGPGGVTVGAKVGPFSGTHTFGGPGAPELEPPTIEGTPGAGSAITPQGPPPIPPASDDPLAQAAGAMNAKNDGEARAARQVQGVPEPAPPAPPAPPQPPPIHEVTPEMAHGLAQTIQKLPPEVRAQALIEMHGKMAEQLLRQGKVVGPDGKLEVIDSPKAADRVAQAFINDEVERQDKLAEEQAKNKPAAAAPKSAPNPNDNIIAQAKALPRESGFSDVDTFVKENTHESSSERASVSGNQPQGEASGSAVGTQADAGNNQPAAGEPGNAVRKTGREAFTKGDRVQLEDGRKATVIYTSPEDPFVRVQIDGGGKISKGISKLSKLGVESGNEANQGTANPRGYAEGRLEPNAAADVGTASAAHVPLSSDNGTKPSDHGIQHEPAASAGSVAGGNEKVVPAGAAVNKSSEKGDLQLSSEGSAVDRGGGGGGSPVHGELPKFKFGNTQAPIPEDSEAHRALESARARISPEDLAGKGSDVGGNHVTVRYGIKGEDTEGIKKFLSQQAPFEASLGKTEKFPPSEHSEGAAVIKAPIESPELHRLNADLEQHGEFTEPSFKDYKPHATVAYVKPEKADRYVGMSVTHGKKFTVSEIAISKQDGSQEVVKLEGKKKEEAPAPNLQDAFDRLPRSGFKVTKADIVPTPEGGVVAVPHETPTDSLINAVYNKLKDGESLGNVTDLNKLTEEHLGSSRTSGAWTPKDAFDAMEAGVNKYLLDRGSSLMALPAPQGLKMLRELMPRITSQGVRTEEQIKNQQFSTPPTESYTAAKVAGLKPTDVVLEPSAGNGGLAVWPKAIGAEVHVNETSPRRQEMLQAVGFGKLTAHDGEIINSLLDPKIKPTVVLMNPPFSASTLKSFEAKNNNQYGFNHVDSALQRLEDGGRLVAILGGGQANEPNGGASLTRGASGKWFERIAEKYNVRANIRVHGKEYQKYGTAFATRLIVIDKDGATPSRVAVGQVKSWASVKQANVNTLEEAYDALRDVAESRPEVQHEPRANKHENQPRTGVEPVYYLPNAEGFQERDRVADMLAKILKEYPVKAEAAKPESLLTGESGELNVSRLAEVVKNFADQDIKPTLEKAGVGIRDVAALGLKALYPRVEQSNPIGRALKAAAPSDAVDALMEVQGDRAKNLAEFDLILNGVEKMFDHLPEEQRIEFVDRIQTGKEQPSPDLLDIAEMFKKIMDGQRDAEEEAINLDRPHHITAAQKSPIELARKENYFHNWWETRPGKEAQEDEAERISGMFMPRRPLEGSKGYNKRQSYTLKSGIQAGGEPVTTNPVRILRHRLEDGMKWITARRAWHELGQLDLKTFVAPGDRNPPGFDSIDDKIAKVYFPAELASGKTAIIPGGRYAVEANTARLLNNMLSVDKVRGNALGRGLMWLKNMSTALELGWSPFHAVFESIEAMSSMMSLGMQRGYNQGLRQGKPEELLQGLKEIISSPAAPISLAREGAALPAYIEARARLGKIGLTEFGHVISGDQPHGIKEAIEQFREVRKEKAIQRLLKRYPDLDQLVDDMFQGGLVVGQHRDYQVKALGKTMTEAWTADNPLGAVWRAIPTIGQGVMYPLFNIYIPNLKYSLFLRMMSEQVSEHSRELEDGTLTRATLARRVADSVENRFGELNFDTLFLNRSVKTALQFAFRSATYKMGTAREIAGGVGGQTRELAVWAHDAYGLLSGGSGGGKGTGGNGTGAGTAEEPEPGKTFGEKALPRLDMRASWIMSLLLTSVILGAVAARLLSKKWPWQWLEDDEDLPGGTLRHLYLETIHPRTGETDSRGKPVRVSLPTYLKEIEHASTEPVKYVLGSLSSILSRGLDLAENRDFFGNYVYNPHATLGTKLKQGAEYMEPVPFVYSSFERGKQQGLTTTAWLSAFGFPKAPSDLDFTPAEKLARSLAKHEPETPEELQAWRAKREALEDGTATREEVKKYLRTQRLTWLQRQVKGMGYGDALDVMDAANDSERAELAHIIDTKRKNALKSGKGAEIEELEEEHSK